MTYGTLKIFFNFFHKVRFIARRRAVIIWCGFRHFEIHPRLEVKWWKKRKYLTLALKCDCNAVTQDFFKVKVDNNAAFVSRHIALALPSAFSLVLALIDWKFFIYCNTLFCREKLWLSWRIEISFYGVSIDLFYDRINFFYSWRKLLRPYISGIRFWINKDQKSRLWSFLWLMSVQLWFDWISFINRQEVWSRYTPEVIISRQACAVNKRNEQIWTPLLSVVWFLSRETSVFGGLRRFK